MRIVHKDQPLKPGRLVKEMALLALIQLLPLVSDVEPHEPSRKGVEADNIIGNEKLPAYEKYAVFVVLQADRCPPVERRIRHTLPRCSNERTFQVENCFGSASNILGTG